MSIFRQSIFIVFFGVFTAFILSFINNDPLVYTPYQPSKTLKLVPELAPNLLLIACSRLARGEIWGLESIAVDQKTGDLYGGSADGYIVRIEADTEKVEKKIFIGGRPLGIHFDPREDQPKTLLIAEAVKGLMSWNLETNEVSILSSFAGDRSINYANDLDVHLEDGEGGSLQVFFSDSSVLRPIYEYSSKRWSTMKAAIGDIFTGTPTGRLLSFDFKTRTTTVLVDGLAYANGVAVSSQGDYVLVAESGRYSIHRHWLKGQKAGQTEIFLDNLPGFPDGISRSTFYSSPSGSQDFFWLSLVQLRNPLLDFVHPLPPTIKKVVAQLPEWAKPKPKPYGMLLRINSNGTIVESLHDPTGSVVPFITSATEHNGYLYFGGLERTFVPVFDLTRGNRNSDKKAQ